MQPEIFLIYARAANGVIGTDGGLPWHLPDDLAHFKALTMGKPMVMGRKTFDSLPGVLPGRPHIVLTRDADWHAQHAERAASPDEAIALATRYGDSIAIIGGAAVFGAFLPRASRIELTAIYRDYAGDVAMPPLGAEWSLTAQMDHTAKDGRPAFAFLTYARRGS